MGQLRKINNNTSGRLRKISDNTQNSNINFVPTGNPTLKQSGNLSQGGGSLLYSESGSGSLFKKKKDNISTLDSVLTTIGDAALESTQATLGLVENLVSDPLTRLTGAVVGIFNKDLSKQIKDYADNDIVGSMFGKSDDLNIGLISKESRKMIDEYSLLGDVGDAVSQGVGTSLGLGAAGSVISGIESGVIGSATTSKGVQAANTFATSGISSYNSKLSEMHKAGYDEHNSQIAALKEGIFEGITENIGAGIPGLNTSGAFESLETSLGNAITKSLNKTAGKIAVNVLKAGEESSEEFFNNLFNEVSDRILYQIDKNYTYGKDEKSDSLIKDIFNEKTLEAMVSAGISSALTMGGSNVFDKVSTNKAIKSYAKDNNISFKEARDTINKYKQTISENLQRNGEESIVEANQQASAIALRSAKDGSIAYNENRLKNLLKVTNDTEENIRKDLVSGRYDRYTFKKGTNANENALEMSFRDAGADNSQRTKDLVDLGKSIQNATKNKVQVRATNREQLLQNNNVLNSINKDIRISQQELIKEEQQEINRINNEYEAQLNSIDSTGMLDETLEASIRLEQQEKIQDIRQEYTRRLSEVKDKIQNEFLDNLNGFMTKDENGNAVLVVNYDSTNTESGKFIIGHELTHTLENVEGYEEYKKLINEYYQKNNSEEYNNHKKQLEKLYANNKGNIEAEMTADLTGKMFSDEKFLTNMLNTKANMFTNIYSKVKELYYKATGQQEKAQLEEIMRNFRNVYAKVKNADIDKEVKLSLSEEAKTLYHGTTLNAAFKIQKQGLKTNQAIGADPNSNARDTSIFLSSDYKNAKSYAERKDRTNNKMLRVKQTPNIIIDDLVESYKGNNDYLTRKTINPEDIQIEVSKGVWTPIQNYDLYLDTPENEKVLDKSLLYDDNYNKITENKPKYSLSTKDNQGRELTKEQQEYFKDSKVRDENGNLKTVYHGTSKDFTVFDKSKIGSNTRNEGIFGKGFYLTNNEKLADNYNRDMFGNLNKNSDKKAMELYVDIKNPFVWQSIKNKEEMEEFAKKINAPKGLLKWNPYSNGGEIHALTEEGQPGKFAELLQKAGYDGIIYNYGSEQMDMINRFSNGNNTQEIVAFESNQIKNVDNLNPTEDSDIRYSMSEEQETTPNEDAIRNQIVKEMPELPFVEDTDKGIENNNITPYTNSKGGILSDEDIKTRANELINEKINRNTLRTNERALEEAKISLNLDKQKVDEFNNSLNQYRGMTSEQLSQSKARDDIYDFVQKNSTMTYKENFEDETLKKAKNELRKTKIKITDELKNSITDYNEFKKSVFGKLTLSNEGQGVDSVYNEFKEMYPSYFEELNTEEDMLYKLKDFMESNTNTINEETYELTPNEIKSFADRIYYALQRGRLSESELNKYVSEINSKMENVYNRRLAINKYREDAKQYTKNLDLIKDKKMGILYQINTAKRNIRDIMPKDMAEEWYNHYIKPVSDNNAKANITHQYYNDRIAKYNLNDEESTYVQMIGEKGHNPQTTLTDNQIIDFYNKNQNKIDKAKCEKAVEEFRSIYDELYNSINQVLRANGYKGLEYRKGYFPHFIEEKSTSFLGKLAEKMGWKKLSGALPTDIAGITEEFKPGKAWTSFTQQRTGDATDYNALKGFDNYLNGAMDVIFHTEDIQKLRALENEIRYQYSDKGVKEKIDSIMNDDSLDIEEKYDQIQSTLSNVRNNPLGNLVSEIREYTNNLANKKSFSDRSMEQLFGRNTYSISKQIMSRVSANMVGANVSSAMTNFIPITQAWGGMSTKNLFKGIQSTIQATFKDDGFSNNSVWLTNRTKQADRLYKSKLDKINEKLGIPFEAVDSFTSNVIVRGKYLDNIEKGMSEQEAISNADEFAKDVMAGRSKGETPTAFNKTNPLLKMFTAFQLEVNNQYGYMFKDLPASAGEAKDKLAAALLKVFLGAFLYNWLSEKITGRKSAFSPIDTAIDNIETATNENLDFGQKLQAITKDVSQELPFVSGIVGGGRLPISSAIPFANRSEYQDSALELMVEAFGEDEAKKAKAQKELLKEFSKPIYFLALPFAGGQIKKTIEGAEMYSHELPGSYTTSGNLRFEAPQDALGKAQALVFGQYASENAREYFDKGYSALTPKQVQEAQNADLSINEYREYQKGMKGKTKISEQVDYINSLPYSEEQKESLIKDKTKKDIDVSNYNNYDSYDEFNYAMNNPAKYDIIKQIVDYKTYNTYNDDIKKIKANSNNAKKEVINYIEKLNLNKYQKTMLYRISGGYSIKNYKDEMYNYINSLNITANEKKNIWKELYGG